jgi:hypothetical protein
MATYGCDGDRAEADPQGARVDSRGFGGVARRHQERRVPVGSGPSRYPGAGGAVGGAAAKGEAQEKEAQEKEAQEIEALK